MELSIHEYEAAPLKGRLECPSCCVQVSISDLFSNCSVSWPQKKWLYFTCFECDISNHVSIKNSTVSLGLLDGGPAPCFIPFSSIKLENLLETTNSNGIKIQFQSKNWFFVTKK